MLVFGGRDAGAEYFAGWVTEYALSIDNLFVFLVLLGSFKVPRADQQKVLLFGIVFSLIARTGFIFLGAALINSFAWVFYVFGLILLITAGNLLKPRGRGRALGRQHHHPHRPAVPAHLRRLRRRQAVHRPGRQAGADADAAGHGGDRRHRPAVRAGLDPGHLRPDPERVHGLHRHRVLAARPAPALLPAGRPAGPARSTCRTGWPRSWPSSA